MTVGLFQGVGHRAVHRGGEGVLVRAVHPHDADRALVGGRDVIAHIGLSRQCGVGGVTVGAFGDGALQAGCLHRDVLREEPRDGDARGRLGAGDAERRQRPSASMQPPAALPLQRR